MQLEKNMYARSNKGVIGKIISTNKLITLDVNEKNHYLCLKEKEIVKASFNLIDLIKVGDYVNGYLVTDVYRPDGNGVFRIEIERNTLKGHIIDNTNNIKSIVTKEQFESMEYEVKNEC